MVNEPEEFIVTAEEVRCSGITPNGFRCDRLLTVLKCFISVSHEIKTQMEEKKMTISQVIAGVQIKVGLETKCRLCKQMDYKLKVI